MSRPAKVVALHVNGLTRGTDDPLSVAHVEERVLLKTFLQHGWRCYLMDWHGVDAQSLICDFVLEAPCYRGCAGIPLAEVTSLLVARSLGSVEGQYDAVAHYFQRLGESYPGVVINDPAAVRYGMNKRYLHSLDQSGYPVVPSRFFDATVTYEHVLTNIPWEAVEAVIKPVSGECGNSVVKLLDADEHFLRRKQTKVKGWVVQKFLPGIHEGEVSLIFVGGKYLGGVRKIPRDGDFRVNERWSPTYEPFSPAMAQLDLAREILAGWPHATHLARIDMVRDGTAWMVLEVETVNPGFLYHPEANVSATALIADELVLHAERLLGSAS